MTHDERNDTLAKMMAKALSENLKLAAAPPEELPADLQALAAKNYASAALSLAQALMTFEAGARGRR